MQCCVLDWILKQKKKDVSGKRGLFKYRLEFG